jgi:hypothetical protein
MSNSRRVRSPTVLVPLPATLREYVDARAQLEDRSRAAIVRRLIAEAHARDTGADFSKEAGAAAPA